MTTCNRRELLQWSFRAGLGLTFGQTLGITSLLSDPAAKAKSCILLWMAGGPSQIDTFDPKTNSTTAGEFKAISTAVPGMRFSEHLLLLARESKDLAILRSMNSKEGNHERARYFVHSGYAPTGVTQHPSFGAIVARELMQKSQTLPAYISINGPAMPAGLLGVSFAPFVIRDAEKPPDNLTCYAGITRERFEDRMELLNALNANFNGAHEQPELEKKEMIYQKAIDLMNSPDLIAFDLSKEKESIRQQYGNSKIGNGCLMARRLIEKGVRFVEVEMDGWDTHVNNFTTTKSLLQQLDPAFSCLIRDLRQRGLLDTTLVIWIGEFGRTPQINANAGRDHWPQAWCAVASGGGITGGQIIGSTDSKGYEIKDDPITVPDLYATFCRLLGINAAKYNSSPLGRPIRIVDNGKPIVQLL